MAKSEIVSCVACGHDVARSAKACPNCGAKPVKPFGKTFNGKLLKLIIILYVCIGIDFIVFDRAMPSSNDSTTESSASGIGDTETTTSDTTGVLDTTQPVTDTNGTNTDGAGVDGANPDTTTQDAAQPADAVETGSSTETTTP